MNVLMIITIKNKFQDKQKSGNIMHVSLFNIKTLDLTRERVWANEVQCKASIIIHESVRPWLQVFKFRLSNPFVLAQHFGWTTVASIKVISEQVNACVIARPGCAVVYTQNLPRQTEQELGIMPIYLHFLNVTENRNYYVNQSAWL